MKLVKFCVCYYYFTGDWVEDEWPHYQRFEREKNWISSTKGVRSRTYRIQTNTCNYFNSNMMRQTATASHSFSTECETYTYMLAFTILAKRYLLTTMKFRSLLLFSITLWFTHIYYRITSETASAGLWKYSKPNVNFFTSNLVSP